MKIARIIAKKGSISLEGFMANQPLEALVYTNENCVGCNKCISACPVLTANRAVEENGMNKIVVDGSQCISCGACFDACAHGARS